ncbi:prephenate dehydrogenase [Parvularcula bermudensis HTCC2503]|uniref:prephenate dehydrogenase n=1 Tax=Parvularcula bermudensis (strain ATCC BAA-594 / HTCC2503 / KCTC 12087) TaxID=314260 RepID=E0TF91_PARBH|nr:prephenate/arogenate dehydrogenase family protein [Parvularcula bermudensis]ADM09009.1 prephenate dehydrogenase [Parvularcula bermudensis HTCC2503]
MTTDDPSFSPPSFVPFERLCLIGLGLIGSSLGHATRRAGAAREIIGVDRHQPNGQKALEIGFIDTLAPDLETAVTGADLVILATPVGAFDAIGKAIGPHLSPGAIVSDVGSVKGVALDVLTPHLPAHIHLLPAHPVAGTENSGPEAGFASLFDGRWSILTPPEGSDPDALSRLTAFWEQLGATVEIMTAAHHDLVLAITSHIPHLIAYNIVGTAADLETVTKSEVIKFSAGGFRDFTRIAASDPDMWRDIFLSNKDAVLEMLGRFSEDLSVLQRAIRDGDGATLHDLFSRTRAIRREIIEAGQDAAAADFGRRPPSRADDSKF